VDFLSALNVKQKVFSGFGLMQILIVAVAISALISLSATETDVVVISEDIQPAVLSATELQYHIERANSSLGFYLLSKEQSHKDSYLESLAKLDVVLGKLQNLQMVQDQPLLKDHVNEIAGGVNQFKQYRDRVLTLAESRDENIPGVRYAAVNLSPRAQEMLNLMSMMIQAEVEEELNKVDGSEGYIEPKPDPLPWVEEEKRKQEEKAKRKVELEAKRKEREAKKAEKEQQQKEQLEQAANQQNQNS